MSLRTFIVDSFTDAPFNGNPAGVCITADTLPQAVMQNIAFELGLSETAFVTNAPGGAVYNIRYFSPQKEIPLCGHATLAAAKVLAAGMQGSAVEFVTVAGVRLNVAIGINGITMQFPVYELTPATVSAALLTALGVQQVKEVLYSAQNNILMLQMDSAAALAALQPDFAALKASHDGVNGVLVTAVSADILYDYEYRYFWPWAGTDEDPVTGGVQTFLAKYWSEKLGKTTMTAFQSSKRTGMMQVTLKDDSVFITGNAVIILEGNFINY